MIDTEQPSRQPVRLMDQDQAAALLHHRLDALFAELRIRQPENFNPPCKAGCFWCCYEALFVSRHEADFILHAMTAQQIEALKPRVMVWLTQAREGLNLPYDDNIALKWRALNVPCPFLVEGKCSVYDRRPAGCRVFFAHSHPENCAMPMRKHQKFAVFPHPSPVDLYLGQYLLETGPGKHQLDHLGIHLANALFGKNAHSNAAQAFEVVEDSPSATGGNHKENVSVLLAGAPCPSHGAAAGG